MILLSGCLDIFGVMWMSFTDIGCRFVCRISSLMEYDCTCSAQTGYYYIWKNTASSRNPGTMSRSAGVSKQAVLQEASRTHHKRSYDVHLKMCNIAWCVALTCPLIREQSDIYMQTWATLRTCSQDRWTPEPEPQASRGRHGN